MTDLAVFNATERRRTLVLSASQALLMIGTSTMITEAALVGYMLADNKSLATVPVALMQLVVMLATFPISFFMKRFGRRAGFTLGAGFGIAGQSLCVYAIFDGSFLLFCVGSAINGVYNAVGQFYRFAAADGVAPTLRPKAISYVLAGGVAAAVIGPEIARLTHDMFEPVAFGGSFAALALIACVALIVVQWVDIPVPSGEERTGATRPLLELLAQPKAAVAVLAGAIGYAIMSLVMNATPLAMIACGMVFGDAARTIQAHVLAMFVPSFFTGSIIMRYGVVRVMGVGAVLLLGSAGIVLAGIEFWNFYVGLILLGLGWNFLYIGATTLLTETYKPAEKAKMQAANDSIVFGSVALAAGLSGWMHNTIGWAAINLWSLPLIVLALGALVWLAVRKPQPAGA